MENVINKVVLSGFAGADAEVKTIGSQKLAKVSLAVHDFYKNAAGEEVKSTNWFTLTFWNTKADIAEEQIKKGTALSIGGRLQVRSYDAKDGSKRFGTDIIVTELVVKDTSTKTAFQ